MLRNSIKIAWRTLLQSKLMSALNIGGLAIAMSGSILMLLWVQNELRFDNYHKDAERINLLTQYHEEGDGYVSETPFPAYAAIQESIPEAEMLAMGQPSLWMGGIFEVNGHRFSEKNAMFVDTNWTKMFTYKVLKGSLADFNASANKIIITQSKSKKYFGSLPPLEQTLYIDSIPYTVAAVVEDIPANSSIQQDVLIPNKTLLGNKTKADRLEYWGFYSQLLFVKLAKHTNAQQTAEKVDEIFLKNQEWIKEASMKSQFVPLLDLHFKQELAGHFIKHGNLTTVHIFTLLAILLLITASINFVNLSIAKISLRMKEMGVRKVVGAGKGQLFTQVMVETTLSIVLAIGIALLLSVLVLPFFNNFTEKHFVINLLEGPIALLLLSVFIFVLVLTGPYPAWVLARLNPIGLLKDNKFTGLSRQGFRKVLVVGQLTFAVVMLIGVTTIYRQFSFIQQQVAGYEKEQVFTIITPPPSYPVRANDKEAVDRLTRSLNSFKSSLLASSAIQSVSQVNGVSMINDKSAGPSNIVWTGYPKMEKEPYVVQLWVDEDYGELANLELKSGRWFEKENLSDKHNVILNETAVKAYELKEPIVGTTFTGGMHGAGGVVIGVVKDFHHKSLHEKIDPVIITMDPFIASTFLVKTHPHSVKKALEDVQEVWSARYPAHPFDYLFLDGAFDQLYKDDRRALLFSFLFGGLSILISCLGLLGMVIVTTQQRTKEIGIRKVMGASVSGIVQLLSKEFLKLVFIAIVIASPIAWWAMNKWLQDYAYRIILHWWIFGIAGLAVIVIALFTISLQTMKAALTNPVNTLRDE